jgi:hypothetical protein
LFAAAQRPPTPSSDTPAEDLAVLGRLRELDLDRMTPIEALTLLAELRASLRRDA